MIFIGVLIILQVIFHAIQLFLIQINPTFDDYYYYIYILLLLPIFISFTLFILYFFQDDTQPSRPKIPIAIICAFLTSILIALWITIYIAAIYPGDTVWTGSGEKPAPEDPNQQNEKRENKSSYILKNSIWWYIMALVYFIYFFLAR